MYVNKAKMSYRCDPDDRDVGDQDDRDVQDDKLITSKKQNSNIEGQKITPQHFVAYNFFLQMKNAFFVPFIVSYIHWRHQRSKMTNGSETKCGLRYEKEIQYLRGPMVDKF